MYYIIWSIKIITQRRKLCQTSIINNFYSSETVNEKFSANSTFIHLLETNRKFPEQCSNKNALEVADNQLILNPVRSVYSDCVTHESHLSVLKRIWEITRHQLSKAVALKHQLKNNKQTKVICILWLSLVFLVHLVNSRRLLRRLKQAFAGRRVKLIRIIITAQLLSNLKLLLGTYNLELSHSLFSRRLTANSSGRQTKPNKIFLLRKYLGLLFPNASV